MHINISNLVYWDDVIAKFRFTLTDKQTRDISQIRDFGLIRMMYYAEVQIW